LLEQLACSSFVELRLHAGPCLLAGGALQVLLVDMMPCHILLAVLLIALLDTHLRRTRLATGMTCTS